MCPLMIHKEVIVKCQVFEGAVYLVDGGTIIIKTRREEEDDQRKRPQGMCEEWIEVGKTG